MKRFFLITIILTIVGYVLLNPLSAHAQMMGGYNFSSPSSTPSDIKAQKQEEQEGKNLIYQLNSKSISCQQITDSQFEKIGEYFMSLAFAGNTDSHVQANNRIKAMMGETGEEQMHIAWGKRGTNCDLNAQFTPGQRGGGVHMMGWSYGWNNMMSGNWGVFGLLGILFWIVGFIDLILVGIYLWKKIQK